MPEFKSTPRTELQAGSLALSPSSQALAPQPVKWLIKRRIFLRPRTLPSGTCLSTPTVLTAAPLTLPGLSCQFLSFSVYAQLCLFPSS